MQFGDPGVDVGFFVFWQGDEDAINAAGALGDGLCVFEIHQDEVAVDLTGIDSAEDFIGERLVVDLQPEQIAFFTQ